MKFFDSSNRDEGLKLLRDAARTGHVFSNYLLGMILLLCDKELMVEGIEVITNLKKSVLAKGIELVKCRTKFRQVVHHIYGGSLYSCGLNPRCCTSYNHVLYYDWDLGFEYVHPNCDLCLCDIEIAQFL